MEKKSTILSAIGEIVTTGLVSLAIFLFVYVFLLQPHRVKGESMVATFADGELLLTEKVTYRFAKPKRGDVAVFAAPTHRGVEFIKRIVGLPGEEIRIDNQKILINGQPLDEQYIRGLTEGSITINLAKDQYFVLGDNRGSSSDSRSFGPISQSSIRGRAWLVYWPIIKTSKSSGMRFVSSIDYRISHKLDDF